MQMADHVRIAAILRIIYSALGFILAAVFLLFLGGLGTLGLMGSEPAGAAPATFWGLIFGGLATVMVICALPGLLTGWGMLQYRPWARILGIVLAALDLFAFPVGTALGVYSLWVLFHPEVVALFEGGGRQRAW
jgi:hypothetical protein